MPAVTDHPPGTFCWLDLATSDAAAAKAFYAGLFGWTFEDVPTDHDVYTIARRDGQEAVGLFTLTPDMGPPRWQAYVAVTDAEAAVHRAVGLGAQVLMPAMDAMEAGRMAVIQDPTGAALSVWQPKAHRGAAVVNEPGAQCWVELQTGDPAGAADFYGQLFGWGTRASRSVGEGAYDLFTRDGSEVAGLIPLAADWGPVPPNWAVYLGVANCDDAIAEAGRLGGTVLVPPMEVENVGRFAFLADPQGAVFAVIALTHPE
jgi:hypothetical protein